MKIAQYGTAIVVMHALLHGLHGLAHQGFLIACPEYNSSITPLLKNAIDWASRPEPDEPSLVCFEERLLAPTAFSLVK